MNAEQRSSGFARHAATYAVGNVARQLVGFLMLPVYTRYLTPADYGVVGLLTFALAFLEPLFGARLAAAVPKFYFDATDRRSKDAVIWSALIVTGSVSALTTIALILVRHPASKLLFGNESYAGAMGFFAVNMLSQPIEYTGMTYLRLLERSRLFLGVSVGKMFFQLLLNLLLVIYLRLSVVGVVLSGIISSIGVGIGLVCYIAARNRLTFDVSLVRRMLQFCWPIWFGGLAGLYVGSSGGLFLRVFDALSDVGLLELGQKFASAVILLIWTPFFQHWEPMSYSYYRENLGKEKFQLAFVTVAAMMFVAGLAVSIFAGPLISVMAAPAFHAAAITVPFITLGLILQSLASFFYFGFFVTNRTKLYGVFSYIRGAIITVAYVGLIPKFGLEGAAVGQCIAFSIGFVWAYFWSRGYFDPAYSFRFIAVLTLISATGYVCSMLLPRNLHLMVDLLVRLVVFAVASVVMVLTAVQSVKKSNPVVYESARGSLLRLSRDWLLRHSAKG